MEESWQFGRALHRDFSKRPVTSFSSNALLSAMASLSPSEVPPNRQARRVARHVIPIDRRPEVPGQGDPGADDRNEPPVVRTRRREPSKRSWRVVLQFEIRHPHLARKVEFAAGCTAGSVAPSLMLDRFRELTQQSSVRSCGTPLYKLLAYPESSLHPPTMRSLPLPADLSALLDTAFRFSTQFIPAEELSVGDGSVLAARWKHRRSFDIDLTVSRLAVSRRAASRPNLFFSLIDADEKLHSGYLRADLAHVQCQNQTHSFSWLFAPPLTAAPLSRESDPHHGLPMDSSAEILARKLYYRMGQHGRYLPRDIYDLAWASIHHPATFAEAAYILIPQQRSQVTRHLRSLPPDAMLRTGSSELLNPADRTLASEAPGTLAGALDRIPGPEDGPCDPSR